MSKIDTGGPAFPIVSSSISNVESGMTLRDYIAAHVAASYSTAVQSVNSSPERVATRAYEIADALIAERKVKTKD
jgi:hypothetical protein